MRDISSIRQDIDKVDSELSALFEARMDLAKEVAAYKQETGKPLFDPEREKQVLEKRVRAFPGKDEDFLEALRVFYQTLMDLSKEEQKRLISKPAYIGYYGVPGSFTHEAFIQMFGEETPEKHYQTFEEIFEAVKSGEIRYGVVPLENSLTGIIDDVYDLLGRYQFYIVRECMVEVKQNLMALPGTKIGEIREVYSHPQGFAQSSSFLKDHPEWKLIPYYNTSRSAQMVREANSPEKACIAGNRSALLYGLEILEEGIQDYRENFTRFAVIAPNMEADSKADQISLYFTLEHRPGSLYGILEEFSKEKLNLLRIDSRPIKGKIWEYAFFVDIEGNLNDPIVKKALQGAREHCLTWRVLGNYHKL